MSVLTERARERDELAKRIDAAMPAEASRLEGIRTVADWAPLENLHECAMVQESKAREARDGEEAGVDR